MASVWCENMLGYLSLDIGRIYTKDELSDAEFILEGDLFISDDLASWDG